MKFIALLAIFVVFFGSSASFRLKSSENRILDGSIAEPGQFPHQVAFRNHGHELENINRCGGSIISDRWVLSSARCIGDKYSAPNGVYIVVGASRVYNDGQAYNLSRTVRHPKLGSYGLNDIALAQTGAPIQISKLVKAIPMSKQFVDGGVEATVSGWGLIQSWPYPIRADHLQFLHVTTLTNEVCRSRLPPPVGKQIYDQTVCVDSHKRNGRGVCQGDEGGPLISNGKLIAIVDWRQVKCGSHAVTAFTRISAHLEWIQSESGIVAV